MARESEPFGGEVREAPEVLYSLLRPVTVEETKAALAAKNKVAPGPDGYSWSEAKEIDVNVLASAFNAFLLNSKVPTQLTTGLT